jgi:hypothetical protein
MAVHIAPHDAGSSTQAREMDQAVRKSATQRVYLDPHRLCAKSPGGYDDPAVASPQINQGLTRLERCQGQHLLDGARRRRVPRRTPNNGQI